jgi:hypothetical protein
MYKIDGEIKKMNPEKKEKWLSALKEFQQGKGKLRSEDNKYCCWGVLCEVYLQEGNKGEWKTGKNKYYFASPSTNSAFYPTSDVLNFAGIDDSIKFPAQINNEDYESVSIVTILAELNDKGFTFDQISQFIKENL